MNAQITQAEVNQAAWSACDTFRGAVDAGQYTFAPCRSLFKTERSKRKTVHLSLISSMLWSRSARRGIHA